MGKALLIARFSATLGNGEESNLFGYGGDETSEVNTQANCTENATFSNFRSSILSGNSGTATFRFRDAGANGNQTFQITGSPGTNEDAVNTDILSAGDLFNIAYTDTGTDSTLAWMAGNVQFSSGHGNFHGAGTFAGVTFDAQSSTRFIGVAGRFIFDGVTTEDNVALKVRGYDTFEALQVRVTANARTNNSVLVNRINKGDGTGSITFAASETGLKTVSGLADAITDGQVVDVSIPLLDR